MNDRAASSSACIAAKAAAAHAATGAAAKVSDRSRPARGIGCSSIRDQPRGRGHEVTGTAGRPSVERSGVADWGGRGAVPVIQNMRRRDVLGQSSGGVAATFLGRCQRHIGLTADTTITYADPRLLGCPMRRLCDPIHIRAFSERQLATTHARLWVAPHPSKAVVRSITDVS